MHHAIESALFHARGYDDRDPTYAELMRTYVDWGRAAQAGDVDACADLAARSEALSRIVERESEQAWAAWWLRGGA